MVLFVTQVHHSSFSAGQKAGSQIRRLGGDVYVLVDQT